MDIEKMLKEITATYNNFDYQSHLKQPDELYHYTSLNTLQIILKNKQLRFTNRAYLNDKSEGTYVLSLCKRKLMSYGRGKMASIRETPKNLFASIWIVRLRSLIQVFFKAIRCLFRTKQIV